MSIRGKAGRTSVTLARVSLTDQSRAEDREHPDPRGKSVQSVDRAFDVLEVLASHGRPMGISEIARITALPQGTVHRLLLALVARGYARRDNERKYAIGAAALRLGDAANRALVSVSSEYLRQLVQLAGETANLAVLEGTTMVYAAQSPSPHTLRIFAEVGRPVPLHSTAVGKAVLAAMSRPDALRLLDRAELIGRTPYTITTLPALLIELDQIEADGFAVDNEEHELGVRCVAVPLPDLASVRAALSISGPAERLTLETARSLAPAMTEVAAALATVVLGRSPS